MILNRIVELQAKTVTRKITDTQEEYEFIENLIESQKPDYPKVPHHYLIATPFRYPLPVEPKYVARFRPPYYDRNCFYGCAEYRTTVFEYGYHWLSQRVHISGLSHESQSRTHFTVEFDDLKCIDIREDQQIEKIMNRNDYSSSHNYILENKDINSILYPSCRDPECGDCIVTFDIWTLGKQPISERRIYFFYDEKNKKCLAECPTGNMDKIQVLWDDVS